MGKVVAEIASRIVVIETRLCLRVERVVEILFDRVQSNGSDGYKARGKIHILRLRRLCTAQKTFVKNLILEDEHGASAIAGISVTLDGVEDVPVEVGVVLDTAMAAILALAVHHSVVKRLTVAAFLLAHVMGHWVQTEESNQ